MGSVLGCRLRKGDESTQPFLEKYCGWVQTCAAPKTSSAPCCPREIRDDEPTI